MKRIVGSLFLFLVGSRLYAVQYIISATQANNIGLVAQLCVISEANSGMAYNFAQKKFGERNLLDAIEKAKKSIAAKVGAGLGGTVAAKLPDSVTSKIGKNNVEAYAELLTGDGTAGGEALRALGVVDKEKIKTFKQYIMKNMSSG